MEDAEWRAAYLQAALDVERVAEPLYLSLGNEVNRWYEYYGVDPGDPNRFQHYVSLYNEIYDSVKDLSPQTIVFCTFSREIVSENREADLSVLEMFDSNRLDVLAFTSYPYAVSGIDRPKIFPMIIMPGLSTTHRVNLSVWAKSGGQYWKPSAANKAKLISSAR